MSQRENCAEGFRRRTKAIGTSNAPTRSHASERPCDQSPRQGRRRDDPTLRFGKPDLTHSQRFQPMRKTDSLLIVTLAVFAPLTARAADPAKPAPNSDKEPMAETFSLRSAGHVSRGRGFAELDESPEVRHVPHQLRPHDGRADGRKNGVARVGRSAGILSITRRQMGRTPEIQEADPRRRDRRHGGRARVQRRGLDG